MTITQFFLLELKNVKRTKFWMHLSGIVLRQRHGFEVAAIMSFAHSQFEDEVMKTRRANAQTIHLYHSCRISLQSCPEPNQPSQNLWLHCATLQMGDCRNCSYLLTLWH